MTENFIDLSKYLSSFSLNESTNSNLDIYLKTESNSRTIIEKFQINNYLITKYINEFWTSKQRQASSIHEISYRACFKPQLPRFFINLLTKQEDIVFDPFSGRGTTVIEAGLLNRNIISNDINPLSEILTKPRFEVPTINDIEERLNNIQIDYSLNSDIDLSMFYNKKTEAEIISLKNYLHQRKLNEDEDYIDEWIRMVATNRLTGHSTGFFSVYTLPPNQAVSPESQIKINKKRNQIPPYRDVKKIILTKTKSLLSDISDKQRLLLKKVKNKSLFLTKDARNTSEIANNTVQLTVTSPPFLNIVQYSQDNWLRCWFNSIDAEQVSKQITMAKSISEWTNVMNDVFKELFRITKKDGWVVFEVGEVNNGKTQLENYVIPLGINNGFECFGVIINQQQFTKTSNIWGISNNQSGTNSNRIVLFKKLI